MMPREAKRGDKQENGDLQGLERDKTPELLPPSASPNKDSKRITSHSLYYLYCRNIMQHQHSVAIAHVHHNSMSPHHKRKVSVVLVRQGISHD